MLQIGGLTRSCQEPVSALPSGSTTDAATVHPRTWAHKKTSSSHGCQGHVVAHRHVMHTLTDTLSWREKFRPCGVGQQSTADGVKRLPLVVWGGRSCFLLSQKTHTHTNTHRLYSNCRSSLGLYLRGICFYLLTVNCSLHVENNSGLVQSNFMSNANQLKH